MFVRINVRLEMWSSFFPSSPLPSPSRPQRSGHACEDCHSSCAECQGPGPANCTACPSQAILEAGGRCLLCCHRGEEEEEESAAQQQDCCNCTETRGGLKAGPAPRVSSQNNTDRKNDFIVYQRGRTKGWGLPCWWYHYHKITRAKIISPVTVWLCL